MADSGEIVVGANGSVYVNAAETSPPTDSDSGLAGSWTDLGYTSEAGVTFTDSKDTEVIAAWQSFYSVRRIVTARDATVSFVLRQWNEDSVPLAFGGGTVTANGGGEYEYNVPAPEDIDERSMIIAWTDGTKDYRLYFARGMVTEAVETNISRTSAADLPITFAATPNEGDDPYVLFTNDPAFA